jgi:hypothetical protein
MAIELPGNSQTTFERPYSKGMVLNVPPQMVAEGACLEAKNVLATGGGLRRRPGTSLFNAVVAPYPAWQALDSFWTVEGYQKLIAVDQKFAYLATATDYTGLYWEFTSACNITILSDSTLAQAAADTHWDEAVNEIQSGDVLIYGSSYQYSSTIASITNGTDLQLTAFGAADYYLGNWKIRRAFGAAQPSIVDTTVITGGTPKILFADGRRFLYSYDGTTFTDYNAAETDLVPTCVAYFKNRVWIADILEGAVQCRQRIRWTELGDLDDFTNGGYLDLPYVKGAIRRLVPLGDFLVAFFDDAIYVGRQTNLANLPLSFQKLETGGIGLLGMRAVTSWIDSLMFVGQDDIYLLSANGLQPIGTPIVSRTIAEVAPTRHWKICAATDLLNDRAMFGFPKDSNEVEQIWSYNYKTKAWTWEDTNCHMLASNSWVNSLTWETFTTLPYTAGHVTAVIGDPTLEGAGTTWVAGMVGDYVFIDDAGNSGNYAGVPEGTTVAAVTDGDTVELSAAPTIAGAGLHYRFVDPTTIWGGAELATFPSWEAIRGSSTTIKDVYVLKYDTIWKYDVNGKNDNGTAINVEIITRDIDYNLPDDEKVFYQLAVKLETWQTSNLDFTVQASGDRGQHWKSLGTLRIAADKDEGKINFRMRGSCIRFRLLSAADVLPYVLNEITLKVRVLGGEVPGREDA